MRHCLKPLIKLTFYHSVTSWIDIRWSHKNVLTIDFIVNNMLHISYDSLCATVLIVFFPPWHPSNHDSLTVATSCFSSILYGCLGRGWYAHCALLFLLIEYSVQTEIVHGLVRHSKSCKPKSLQLLFQLAAYFCYRRFCQLFCSSALVHNL